MTSAGPDTRAIFRPGSVGSWLSHRPRPRELGYAAALIGAGAVALAFGLWGTERPAPPAATPGAGPGVLTTWGLPISRLVVDVSVVGTVGMLVTGILLPREDGRLGEVAGRCLRGAARLAIAWAVATVAMLALLWSDASRQPVSRLTVDQVFSGNTAHPDATPLLFSAVLAVVIAAAASVTRTVPGVVAVLLLTGYNVMSIVTLGHDEHATLTRYVVAAHVVVISLWVGGLAGMLIHVRRSPELLAVVVPRFSRLALGCLVVVGAFGLTAAWMNLGSPAELRGSHYGTLVIYKAEALLALGIFGWWHRRRTIPDVVGQRSPQAFIRFAAVEVVVMVATIALGVALSRTPAPASTVPADEPAGYVPVASGRLLHDHAAR